MCIVAIYKKKETHFDVSVYLLDEKYYVIIEQLASVSKDDGILSSVYSVLDLSKKEMMAPFCVAILLLILT